MVKIAIKSHTSLETIREKYIALIKLVWLTKASHLRAGLFCKSSVAI